MGKNVENAFDIYQDYIKSLDNTKALAIRYDKNRDNAPIINAKGEGVLAKRMIELAKEYDIPIVNDENSVAELMKIKVGSEIPYCMYEALSIILAHIYMLSED